MSFNWSRFLELANVLGQAADDEAALRSAASRAYYASFHHAKAYLSAKDPLASLSGRGADHEAVPEHLLRPGRTRQERDAGEKLVRMRRLRKWADYDASTKARLPVEVAQALHHAERILVNLASPKPST